MAELNANEPVLGRTAVIFLGVTIVVFASILVVAEVNGHRAASKAAASVARADIDLSSVLYIEQRGDLLDLVVKVTIANKADHPVIYAGSPCYPPATVTFESTRRPPSSPPYPAAAAALRTHVMDDLRTFDQIGYFEPNTTHLADLEPCAESDPPMLPPHKAIVYSMREFLGTAAEPDVDAATTEVVTTLQLGSLPDTWPGRFPPPIKIVQTIQVRTPLSTVSDISRPSMAGYDAAAHRFDLLMKDSHVSAWVDAQDPSLWRAARLRPSYRAAGPTWTLTAFNHAWATPLYLEGTDAELTLVTIPNEAWKAAQSTDAVLPPGASSTEKLWLPYRDLYVGDLVLPSGRVMVGDGIATDDELLFDYGLQPGRYAIHVVTSKPRYRIKEYESVAWEELLLSDSAVTHWEPAVPVGHSLSELKPGELFSFGTDGGGGGFASPEAMKYMDASLSYDSPLWNMLGEREEANDWLWATATLDPKTGANIFVTSTGGDGGFPILLGLDSADRPAVLLSDFGLLQMTYSGIKV